ncbi:MULTISPECIES: DUF983 domain-containing protein [Methylorubrum]|jgi:uncharacterized protein (DUF983 family)|uniref:DUF983 domain-containing protein n=2 Tax=Methylorubrum extorquens TaxID=408 RepID=C5AQX1_METEA|nr:MULTISPECIES: DUF983 domain-containing protein [Methylorubrum]MBA9068892.1 uncharacterized protein (DUF983 family) [Methylobacterium sp. RAS18]ACS42244.1 conserved hypothetical protein; putative membrane protein [Methylorubrum extorquens AM1]EHP91832.1 protein of unknown function DUF983 [Methylorubrum extorquens DSM 13060]MCP1544701.1 uncharacterized protein (DUF983 family) [Methylorubrum extorquens]MCP1587952.1 uncharacterized protein (DUF983 family) [Methylorubrum extorquens]
MTDTRDAIPTETRYEPQAPLSVAARSACPRCGRGHLFKGFLSIAPRCDSCGLDFSFADPADGPAFFVMMTTAIPAVAFGLWLELTYDPPVWLHFALTLPVVLIACTLPLRFFKGWLVASQYVHRAEEGRLARPAPVEAAKPDAPGPR